MAADRRGEISRRLRAVIDERLIVQDQYIDGKTRGVRTPTVIVEPETEEEIATIVKLAHDLVVPVTPLGAQTRVNAWNSVEGIYIRTNHLDGIGDVNEEDLTIKVQAGVQWWDVMRKLGDSGYWLPTHPSSARFSTVGGWFNVGGPGIGHYRYGSFLRSVRALDVVLPSGRLIHVGHDRIAQTKVGYDLRSILFGSEGTLGIVTGMELLVDLQSEKETARAYEFPDPGELRPFLEELTRGYIRPYHIMLHDETHAGTMRDLEVDVPEGACITIGLEGTQASVDHDLRILERTAGNFGCITVSDDVSSELWKRRYHTPPVSHGEALVGDELMIPLPSLERVVREIRGIQSTLGSKVGLMGSLVDVNTVHIVAYMGRSAERNLRPLSTLSFMSSIARIAFNNGGYPSGLGARHRRNLDRIHGDALPIHHELKAAFDPMDIMNPGMVTENQTHFSRETPSLALALRVNRSSFLQRMRDRGMQDDGEITEGSVEWKEI